VVQGKSSATTLRSTSDRCVARMGMRVGPCALPLHRSTRLPVPLPHQRIVGAWSCSLVSGGGTPVFEETR
jgi:hypothetical protein